jgi:RNA-directed DNA polymerase
MSKAKPYSISKQAVWDAYKRVKANRGAAGVDKQSLKMFEKDLKGNLYKIWNRMSSGSYFPPPVRLVEIPKGKGKRPLGIPTVSDRVAQAVAKMYLEPLVEPKFHEDSYGSRPGKSALDAVATARKRCWRRDWVVDLDIKGFFDNLDWTLVMRAVRFHTELKWLHLYVERWLRAPIEMEDGTRVERTKGSPQGSVISPLLANLFMHHAFDDWMARNHPNIQFERYVDDIVFHCVSEKQANFILRVVRQRLEECGLELHKEKTKIVYCQDSARRGKYDQIQFDFLGYTFQPRRAKDRNGKHFVGFLPAISTKSANRIRATIREWRIAATRNNQSLENLAKLTDPYIRGWMNYYGRYYRSKCCQVLRYLNDVLSKWVRRKYKDRFRRKERKATHWLGRIATRDPNLFVLWKLGIKPAAGR